MSDQGDDSSALKGIKQLGGGAAGIGCMAPLIIIGAIFFGRWLDTLLGTEPWLLLVMILVSLPLMILLIIRLAKDSAAGT